MQVTHLFPAEVLRLPHSPEQAHAGESGSGAERSHRGQLRVRGALPPKKVDNLEQFFISRFGRELYETFFKPYTERVLDVS